MKKIIVNNYQTGQWVIHKGKMKRRFNWDKVENYAVGALVIAAIIIYVLPAIRYWFNF